MIRDIQRFSEKEYDLLVIGGGINGAAIANVAAGDGLSVALIDKGDFASGTSSKSTKLLHGGIRYLENFEFGLVQESLKERFVQLINASHLTKSIPFIIPVYKHDKRPLWMMKLGVFLYQLFAGRYAVNKQRNLSREDVMALEPHLKRDDLLGGVMYYDVQMDDARLCLENVLSADAQGAHVANYVEAVDFLKDNGRVKGIKARDLIDNREFTIKAKRTVCAVGPWTNQFLKKDDKKVKKVIRTTKGAHVVYKEPLTSHAVLITVKEDNRIFFVIPWMGHSLIGTTDTNFIASPDEVASDQGDVDYLLGEAIRVFPDFQFKESNIVTTFAGLRPLVRQGGSPSKVSRKHLIQETSSGLVYVIGGKYTTYRKIALECIEIVFRKRYDRSALKYPLYGSGAPGQKDPDILQSYGIPLSVLTHLKNRYGKRCVDVLQLVREDPQLKKPICDCSPTIAAEVLYAIEIEMAVKSEDIIKRRLSLDYLPCPSGKCRNVIAKMMA